MGSKSLSVTFVELKRRRGDADRGMKIHSRARVCSSEMEKSECGVPSGLHGYQSASLTRADSFVKRTGGPPLTLTRPFLLPREVDVENPYGCPVCGLPRVVPSLVRDCIRQHEARAYAGPAPEPGVRAVVI